MIPQIKGGPISGTALPAMPMGPRPGQQARFDARQQARQQNFNSLPPQQQAKRLDQHNANQAARQNRFMSRTGAMPINPMPMPIIDPGFGIPMTPDVLPPQIQNPQPYDQGMMGPGANYGAGGGVMHVQDQPQFGVSSNMSIVPNMADYNTYSKIAFGTPNQMYDPNQATTQAQPQSQPQFSNMNFGTGGKGGMSMPMGTSSNTGKSTSAQPGQDQNQFNTQY
jgi:hypothetical protein